VAVSGCAVVASGVGAGALRSGLWFSAAVSRSVWRRRVLTPLASTASTPRVATRRVVMARVMCGRGGYRVEVYGV